MILKLWKLQAVLSGLSVSLLFFFIWYLLVMVDIRGFVGLEHFTHQLGTALFYVSGANLFGNLLLWLSVVLPERMKVGSAVVGFLLSLAAILVGVVHFYCMWAMSCSGVDHYLFSEPAQP